MYPILIDYPLPAKFLKYWGPGADMANNWKLWIAGLIISGVIAWWGLAPDAAKGRKALGWLGTLGAFAFAALLGGVGVGRLPTIKLHTHGVLVAVGFLIGIVLAVREARRVGEDAERILDLAFWLLITAMVGARLFYVLLRWGTFRADMTQTKLWYQWKIFRLWDGGLVFYGGFLLAGLTFWMFLRLYKMDFWKLADTIIPSVAIGHFFGLLGVYAAGFGYGKSTGMPWSIEYPSSSLFSNMPAGIPLHPTPLYAAIGVLFLFFVLLWRRSEKKYNGQVFLTYLLIYPVLSFVIEVFRHTNDATRFFLVKRDLFVAVQGIDILTVSQAISLGLFVMALLLIPIRQKQANQNMTLSTDLA